eukprot:TRINITY_DN14627_c0_g1_i1.p1 TRINITY_DN14627_c0_g1~~TRINITY_DN14627_c0_g1_i1.p1  ORF type:complete len:480 (-),score=56.06 TRINITY_DN14627_c0_g1_i1:116-1555(-)
MATAPLLGAGTSVAEASDFHGLVEVNDDALSRGKLNPVGTLGPGESCVGDAVCTAKTVSPTRRRRTAETTPLWTLKAYQFLGTAAWACCFRLISIYYTHIGLTRSQIGYISVSRRCASFCGMFFWARLCDYLGEYRSVLLSCNVLSILTSLCNCLPVVQGSVPLVFAVVVGGAFIGSASSAGVIDALCNRVLDRQGGRETYGNQRLWSCLAAAIFSGIAGVLVELFGVSVMFLSSGFFAMLNWITMFFFLPDVDDEVAAQLHERRRRKRIEKSLCRFDVLWFFVNLVIYGLCMALVENFLFVYLLQDFEATPKRLVGAAVTVMCFFEIPVFRWFHHFAGGESPRFGLPTVLVGCHLIFAVRCILYAVIPRESPWLVLFIEPLHGLTFAAMWNAAVLYGKSMAEPGKEATMQAFVAGLYYQLSDGLGSVMWGRLAEEQPHGLGFTTCWILDACVISLWSLIWFAGLRLRNGDSASAGHDK